MTDDARATLSSTHLDLVGTMTAVLAQGRPPTVTADDVHAACLVAVWRAAEKWDRDGDAEFRTYAAVACRHAVHGLYRDARWRGLYGGWARAAHRPRNAGRTAPVFCPLDARVPAATGPTAADAADDRWVVDRVLARLRPREAAVLRLRYLEGQTLAAVGVRLGLTRERVRQLEVEALDAARLECLRCGLGQY